MNYLLDVNVLVAWGWRDHTEHQRTARWIARENGRASVRFLTSSIPQLGFVRVSVQRSAGAITVSDACELLAGMLAQLGNRHLFLPDDCAVDGLPVWCKGAAQTTDAHLWALAKRHGAVLATLDGRIPGAFVLPAG